MSIIDGADSKEDMNPVEAIVRSVSEGLSRAGQGPSDGYGSVRALAARPGAWWLVLAAVVLLSAGPVAAQSNIVINESSQTLAFTCEQDDVTVNGSNNAITLAGACGTLTVHGSGNDVQVEQVSEIQVNGNYNSIAWSRGPDGGAPDVVDNGTGNEVMQEDLSTPISSPETIPATLLLDDPFPNPATAQIAIEYALPQASPVSLTVHDMLGRAVMRVAHGTQAAGQHRTTLDVFSLPAGPYVLRLTTGSGQRTSTFTRLK